MCLKVGWEELSVTLIKDSRSVSIESVQESAQQVEGGGREGAAGHEVERNDGEDDPGITLGWDGGDGWGGIRRAAQGPSPCAPARRRGQHSPIRLGTNRKIFSLGIAAAPLPPRADPGVPAVHPERISAPPRGLTLLPAHRRRPPRATPRCPRPAPDVKARSPREPGPPQL